MGENEIRHAHFVAVTPAKAAQLRSDSAAVAALREGEREETGLGQYWHGVQYLLTGSAKDVRGPFAWFSGGGEELGHTSGGPVRYLSPEQVNALSMALADVEPDDLGDDIYDERAMDAAGVYPGRWVRNAETFDPLGTMRELYSYLREFFSRQSKAGNGVVITMSVESAPDDDEDETPDAPPAPVPKIRSTAPASEDSLLLNGAKGRTYVRLQATDHTALDETFAKLGYRPLGDLAILPVLEGGVVRTYRSSDGTAVAAVILSSERVASTTFISMLPQDAVVVVSDAFVVEKPKKRVFATTMSTAKPGELEAKLRERCQTLEKKHGSPVVMQPDIVSAAKAWEAWWAKQAQ